MMQPFRPPLLGLYHCLHRCNPSEKASNSGRRFEQYHSVCNELVEVFSQNVQSLPSSLRTLEQSCSGADLDPIKLKPRLRFLTSKTACAPVNLTVANALSRMITTVIGQKINTSVVKKKKVLEPVSTILVGDRYEGHVRPFFAFVVNQLDGHH
jgi:hypothetical protein